MPAYTFFHDGELQLGMSVQLSKEEAHHLEHVMRVKVGESVELMNGQGVLFEASVVSLGKKCHLAIESCKKKSAPPTHLLEIVQGMPALNKSDWIVEKLTELGATHISFFGADRSPRQTLSPAQTQKLRAKCIQACKQSGRLWLPTVRWLENLDSWQAPAGFTTSSLVLLDPTGNLIDQLTCPIPLQLSAFIGPESGLSEREIEKLRTLGASFLSIHENILRSETASIVGAALLYTWQRSQHPFAS